MGKTVLAKDITLIELESKFNLRLNRDNHFFTEWCTNLPEINPQEKQFLDSVQEGYLNLVKYPVMLENAVQITVLSPLLHLAGLLVAPFHIETETSVKITSPGEDVMIEGPVLSEAEGRIDVLVLKHNFWILVIESKRAELSIKVGLAQILAYMLANLNEQKPCFGLITNGGNFLFLKLARNTDIPFYGVSKTFDLFNPGNELYNILQIIKNIRLQALD